MGLSAAEQALSWSLDGLRQIGLLSPAAGSTGVLIVVGGPQVRAGSHRQFVRLARAFAAAGFPSLRFDVRGMGDSEGEPRSFEALDDDIAAALDALFAAQPQLRQVVLCGLCDAASAALLYLDARADPRVAGLMLFNPWVRTAHSEAQARVSHYYRERLLDPAFWRKLLGGGVGLAALRGWWQARRQARHRPAPASQPAFPARMARAWAAFPGAILLVLSGRDLTAQEFQLVSAQDPAWQAALRHSARLERHALDGATHTFSEPGMTERLAGLCRHWLMRLDVPGEQA